MKLIKKELTLITLKENNMCCTFEKSEMSNTRLYVGEAEKDDKTVHVLAYQNEAKSVGPNAMVIPFPTQVRMGPGNVIDTNPFKSFLRDITNASQRITKSRGFGRDEIIGCASFDSVAQVFDVGSYTVILADHVKQIPEALTRIASNKRPNVNVDFLLGYNKLYQGQPIAICCWDGAIEAEPLMWWYEPYNTKELFIPTMDAHDGNAPNLDQMVETDHIVSVGSTGPEVGNEVRYTANIPAHVKSLLPTNVYGHRLPSILKNDDCVVKTSDLHTDRYDAPMLARGCYQARMSGWH